MKAISTMRKWINSLTTQRKEKSSKYVDLAPTDKADKSGIYSDALAYATNNPNVSNIALTGPYGSGKSSIIKTFLKKYKRPALQISLAAFLPEANASESKVSKVSKQEIERSILQQILYGADANSLPLSRFRRIQSPKWWPSLVSLWIIFGSFACWRLIQQRSEVLSGTFFEPIDSINWFNFLTFAMGLIFLWQALHYIYLKSFGVSLKAISLKDIEIKPEAAGDESILNRHLDEIIYFFQSTEYDLVIVEDLDRFNNSDIFVTLREINSLINANAGVNRRIRFLYALRDNMFVNKDRTKFFEFIVPVIPIINSSNSIDKMIEQGERLSLDNRLNRQFLREVSRYLNDLRLIQNIFNEYSIYVENLETDDDYSLNTNKLLAILIYKNVCPSDFEELHQEKGKLAKILDLHDLFVSNAEANYKSQISELEQQINAAEKQVPSDLEELRKIYAMALISKLPAYHTIIEFNGNKNIPIQTLSSCQEFDQLVEAQIILCRSHQNQRRQVDISGFQNEVSSHKTYLERKGVIEQKTTKHKESVSKTIRQLRAEISTLRLARFNEIIRKNGTEAEEFFDAFDENRELVRFLVLEGYLDDTYYQYTSLFHSGRLSPNDNKFLIQIRSFNNPEPSFQIDNPKEVIAAMREDDFRQNYALNKTLIDCLFSEPNEYQTQITKVIGFISNNFGESAEFFSAYYEGGKRVGGLMSALAEKWPSFLSAAIGRPDNITHVGRMIAHLPEIQLKELYEKDSEISDFISVNLSDILALGVDFEPLRLKMLSFEIEDLPNIEPYPAVTRILVDAGLYRLSIRNLEFIFQDVLGSTDVADLKIKHYSTILKTENAALIAKTEHDFEFYLTTVLLQLENNREEEISTILKVINHDEIDSKPLEKFLEMQSASLPSLDQVPTRLHSKVFQLQKIDISWENCLAFISSEHFDADTLTAFLQQDDPLTALSMVNINADESAYPLREYLIENNNFSEDVYRAYISILPKSFKKFPQDIDVEKLQIIIEEEKIVFSADNFSLINEYSDLQVLFISKNIELYFENAKQFKIDDEFKEKLLSSAITDNQRLKIIEDMNLTSLLSHPSRASEIGGIYHRTGADVSHLTAEAVQAIVINAQQIVAKISLFNKCHQILTDEQAWNTIRQLPEPFSKIEPGWRRPTIPNTTENLEFVNWLEERKIISSSNITFLGDEIRINTFRS